MYVISIRTRERTYELYELFDSTLCDERTKKTSVLLEKTTIPIISRVDRQIPIALSLKARASWYLPLSIAKYCISNGKEPVVYMP